MTPLRQLFTIGVFSFAMQAQDSVSPAPPVAPQVDHRETRHGAVVVDPYFLAAREEQPCKVTEYLAKENAYTAEMTKGLQPFSDALYTEMLARIQQTDLSVPVHRGGYLYYSRTEEGKQYPIQCRRKGDMQAPEEVLLDLNELGKGRKFIGLGAMLVSDDQNLMAYTLDLTGFRQYGLQVKDLRSGATLGDAMERVTSMAWAADNRHLFLTTEDKVTKRSDKLWRHVLGAAKPELIYEEKDELFDIEVGKSRDKQYLVMQSESKDTSEARILPAGKADGAYSRYSCHARRSTGILWTIAKARSTYAPIRAASISR